MGPGFWAKAILAATYCLNRMPSRILDKKSPHEAGYGVAPHTYLPPPTGFRLNPPIYVCVHRGTLQEEIGRQVSLGGGRGSRQIRAKQQP